MSKSYKQRRSSGRVLWWISRTYGQIRKRSIKIVGMVPEYSIEEFTGWLLRNDYSRNRLFYLFDEWEMSGWASGLCPSIDRINDFKGYAFCNMRLTTWSVNNSRGRRSKKLKIGLLKSIQHAREHQGTRCALLDENGNIAKAFYTLSDAARFAGTDYSNIWRACKLGYKSCGRKWKFL